jgi:hypothetical protein
MAEKLINSRDIYMGQIAASDGDLALLVSDLETSDGAMTLEELEKATQALDKKSKEYGLSIDEMNKVYELIRDNLARTAR